VLYIAKINKNITFCYKTDIANQRNETILLKKEKKKRKKRNSFFEIAQTFDQKTGTKDQHLYHLEDLNQELSSCLSKFLKRLFLGFQMRSQKAVKYGMMFVQILQQSLEKKQPFCLFSMAYNSCCSIEQNLRKQGREQYFKTKEYQS
jgi:hypothetical protein